MTTSPDQFLQYLGWMIALFELVFAGYILYLKPNHRANQWTSALIAMLAVSVFGVASLAGASSPQAGQFFALLLAAVIPLHAPVQLLALLAIYPPEEGFKQPRWKWLQWIFLLLLLIPVMLVWFDGTSGRNLWFSGLPPAYAGGYIPVSTVTQGALRPIIFTLYIAICGAAAALYILFRVALKRSGDRRQRRTGWWLLTANLAAALFFHLSWSGGIPAVLAITGTLLVLIAYGYAVIQRTASDQVAQPGSLQVRLTALALIVAIPMIAGVTLFLSEQARQSLTEAAKDKLSTTNQSIHQILGMWLEYNNRALHTMVSNSEIIAMDPVKQKAILEEMAASYPYMYLVSTVDLNGVNVARSDDLPPERYDDRYWFQNAANGAPLTYEILISRTNQKPALAVSMPIQNKAGEVVGVGMFAAELDQIVALVNQIDLGRGESAFIIDQRNIMVAHSDPRAPVLSNMSAHPAVKAIRAGGLGAFNYTDNRGERIQSYLSLLPNEWGVIVQQTEIGLVEPIRQFQRLAFTVLVLGAALMSLLIFSAIRQTLRPVQELTEAAVAISKGDIRRQVQVSTQDELGLLGHTFNQMTGQLQELISGLEARVAERTQALERRALQMRVTAEVAKEAAAIREPEKLLPDIANLISNRFGYDHTGIFLLESAEAGSPALPGEAQQSFAVLRAASSQGGQRMLKRGHRLRVGRQGLVGYVAATGQPRIALDVGSDSIFFNNPDLPLTRSEIALPLKIQNRVIGVLDVQSNRAAAFSDEDLIILQILADQVALAIENARLLEDSQQAVRELESLYRMQIQRGWSKRLANEPLRYHYDRQGARRIGKGDAGARPSDEPTEQTESLPEIEAPIELRGQRIGALKLRKTAEAGGWSEAEKELIRDTVSQMALSLENARLMEEIRARASQEETINQVIAKAQSSLNLETVMKTAVTEIGRTLRLSRVRIRLGEMEPENGSNGRSNQGESPDENPAPSESEDHPEEDRPQQEAG